MKLFINVDSNYDPLCIYFLLEEKAAGIDGMTKTLNKENNIKCGVQMKTEGRKVKFCL